MDIDFYENIIKEAQQLGINRYVVGAVIVRNNNVLLLERPKDDFMGGIYEFPSGKVEDGETLDEAYFWHRHQENN